MQIARRPIRTGFTLVEILVVVVILGILAAIVVPQFTSAAAETRDNSMKTTVHRIRTQLEIYKNQHNDVYPTFANLEAQLVGETNAAGAIVPDNTVGSLGPYLMQFPINPKTGTKTIGNGAPGTSDWFYNETTGVFRGNDSVESSLY